MPENLTQDQLAPVISVAQLASWTQGIRETAQAACDNDAGRSEALRKLGPDDHDVADMIAGSLAQSLPEIRSARPARAEHLQAALAEKVRRQLPWFLKKLIDRAAEDPRAEGASVLHREARTLQLFTSLYKLSPGDVVLARSKSGKQTRAILGRVILGEIVS